MYLPEKHITLAESLLGLGGVILMLLDTPKSVDHLHRQIAVSQSKGEFNSRHDYDSVMIAVLMLYAIGAVEPTEAGSIRKCV